MWTAKGDVKLPWKSGQKPHGSSARFRRAPVCRDHFFLGSIIARNDHEDCRKWCVKITIVSELVKKLFVAQTRNIILRQRQASLLRTIAASRVYVHACTLARQQDTTD